MIVFLKGFILVLGFLYCFNIILFFSSLGYGRLCLWYFCGEGVVGDCFKVIWYVSKSRI